MTVDRFPNVVLGEGLEIHATEPLRLRTLCGLSLLSAARVERTGRAATCSICSAALTRPSQGIEQQTEVGL